MTDVQNREFYLLEHGKEFAEQEGISLVTLANIVTNNPHLFECLQRRGASVSVKVFNRFKSVFDDPNKWTEIRNNKSERLRRLRERRKARLGSANAA